MKPNPLNKIVIAGGGSAGWMAAASLANALGPGCSIELVESEDIGTVGVGEATIPPIKAYLQGLGIDEAAFLRETGATAKLGIQFEGWCREGERYFHPFGIYGIGFDQVPFHQWWLKERAAGAGDPLESYSMAASLAAGARFAPPSTNLRMVQSTYDYAYHFDAALFAAMLRRYAERKGVQRTEGRIAAVLRCDQGSIRSLRLDGDRVVEGDFFIDCTGFSSLLLGEALGVPFDDWSDLLPCDRAVAIASASSTPRVPYTRSVATEAGWRWRIPLRHRTGNGHVYCSAHLDDDRAVDALLAGLDGPAVGEPRLLRFRTGRRRRPWHRNCLALGLAAGFMEPLESTSLHLVQSGLARFLALFPDRNEDDLRAAEYDRLTREEWERIRDFLVLHYHLNDRAGPFWRSRRETDLPEQLAYRLAHFRREGRLVSPGPELFLNASWLAVLVGQGARPEGWDPLANQRSAVPAAERLATLRQVIREAAAASPTHEAWLAATN